MARLAPLFAACRALRRNTAGLGLIEFAYGLPVLLGIGFSGMEIANMTVTRMRVSQLGMAIGDNASCVGESNGLALKRVFESDMYDVFEGARVQGLPIQFRERGRVIVSSMQRNADGGQWIAWQRCYGLKTWSSTYRTIGTGRTGTALTGIGPAGSQVQATASNAVMFVEIAYDYRALVEPFAQGLQYFGLNVNNQVITYKSAFIVRDPRQLGDSTQASRSATLDYGLFQNTPALMRLDC